MSKRRGATEGSVFKRKDQRWVSRLTLGWNGGKQVRWEAYSRTRSEAQEKLLKARSDHSRGLQVAIEKQSVGEFLDHWLEHTVRSSNRTRSYENSEVVIRCHLKPDLGRIRLDQLAPQHVQALLTSKLKHGLSPRSVLQVRAVLRTALNQAVRWNLVARNAAALVSAPRVPHREIRPRDAAEARRLLDAAKGTRFEAAYMIALNLGPRRGEVLGLRWQDVDLESSTLRVTQALQRAGGKLQATETKT
jgi:integrase